MPASRHPHRRRGVALLVTLLLLALLLAVTARFASSAAVAELRAARQAHDLQHHLAAESALTVVAQRLAKDRALIAEFDRCGLVRVELQLGAWSVRGRVVNDAAKLNVGLFAEPGQSHLLTAKLRQLARRLQLPAAEIRLRPTLSSVGRRSELTPFVWYDQILEIADPGACFRMSDPAAEQVAGHDSLVWSDIVTLFGDGRVDVRHAPPEVLRALLADVDRSAAEELLARRESGQGGRTAPALLAALPERTRTTVASRLVDSSPRRALTLQTTCGGDHRQWYIVADLAGGRVQQLYYRGQLQW